MLSERVAAALRHNHVIEDPDIKQAQTRLEPLGYPPIGCTGFGDPTGVVMPENHRGRVELQCTAGDLPRVNRRAVDCAVERIFGGDDLVLPGPTDGYERQLNAIKGLIAEDPARVAQVVKQWISDDA